jgi:hypothetical protein
MNTEIEQDNIVAPPHYRENGPQQVVTSDTARQGPLGSRVLMVLVISLIGAVIAGGFVVMFWGQSH